MQFSLPCSVFRRMARLPETISADETRHYLRSVYLERRDGHVFAVVTNGRFAAIHHFGRQAGDEGSVNITIDPMLLRQCDLETAFASDLVITVNEEMKFAGIGTAFGYVYGGNAAVYTDTKNEFLTWRNWLPKETPKKPRDGMVLSVDEMYSVVLTSPTGVIVFPEVIDCKDFTIVRDVYDPDWLGVFVPWRGDKLQTEPAVLPVWVRG